MSFLAANKIEKSFGGVRALAEVNFSMEADEVVGLVGPNGAGKTTLFNVLTRFLDYDKGSVHFDGRDVSRMPADGLVRAGMARTFQHVRIFQNLSAIENVAVAIPFAGRRRRDVIDEALGLVEFVGLRRMADTLGEKLSYGQQKLVSIARALATRPKLLMLDEPLSGLSHTAVEEMIQMIKQVRSQKKAVLIIDHNMEAISGLAERIVVMSAGRPVFDGTPDEMLRSEAVIAAYIGRAL